MSIPELPIDLNQTQNGFLPLAQTLWALPYDAATTSDDVQWALDAFAVRRDDYALYGDYLAGYHRAMVAAQAYEQTFRSVIARTRANICPAIVRAHTDRLRLTGFSPHPDDGNEATAAAAWGLYQERRLTKTFNYVFGQAVGLGDAYVRVWPDKTGRAQFTAFRGDQIVVRYANDEGAITLRDGAAVEYAGAKPGELECAAQLWQEGSQYSLLLYYSDRLSYYQTKPNTTTLPDKAAAFSPVREVANTYGRVPLFPFPFEGGPGQYGTSILAPVVPLQDLYNKTLVDREVAAEFAAWPQRYAIGLEPDYDANGKAIPLPYKVGIDRMLTVANPDAKFGQFDAANLEQYNLKARDLLDAISTVSTVPQHLFNRGMGVPPSGEALKTAEAGLVARVGDTQTDFGAQAADVLAFGLVIEGRIARIEDAHIEPDWRDPVSRAQKDEAETMGIYRAQVGLPLAEVLRRMDYTDKEIAGILAASQTEQAFSADLVAGDGSATLAAELAQPPTRTKTVVRDGNGRISQIVEG
jgi:hypothetical protein